MNSMMKKSFSVKGVVALGIGTALFFVLMRYASVPSPLPNTTFGIQYSVQALVSVLYGPVIGFLVGLIGHMFNDMAAGWGVWWSWVIASGFFGFVMGFASKNMKLDHGVFSKKDMVVFNVAQLIAHVIAWGGMAPLLDILIYSEPANKVFAQGLLAGVSNIIATGVVGTLLCLAYANAKPKQGSLEKE